MEYLRNRGCNVSVISRAVAEQIPVPPADADLAAQLKPERIVKNARNAASARVKLLVARNMNQNFSITNFGIGEQTGLTETQEQNEKVQSLKPAVVEGKENDLPD